ncbi:hypothetical protein [Demequina rhizosphaerae]|uniref:hypothetical protein n=1 Tax=Demequina rhizosphaerae TaxID=1638985 RepID=UPI0007809206|nr:hypothetical protein [Demequina rhizosphaerae]
MPNFAAAVSSHLAGGAVQAKFVTMLDSMAQYRLQELAAPIHCMFGGGSLWTGLYFSGPVASVMQIGATTGTVTDSTTAYDAWPTGGVSTYAAGGARTFGVGGAAFTCNKIKVYFIKEPGAGSLKIQVDGVDASGFESTSAAGTLGELCIATITPTLGSHTVSIVGLAGSVRVLGIGMEDTSVSGPVTVNISNGVLESATAFANATARANLQA